MGVFRRAADIVAANVNDIVDRFEEPERMLRHALREMEDLLATTSAAVAQSIAAERLLAKSLARHVAQAERWQARAASALDAGDEALARRAMARKLQHARAAGDSESQLAEATQANDAMRGQLEALRAKHEAARSRLMMLGARQAAAEATRQILAAAAAPTRRARALARFERFLDQAELVEARSLALAELESGADADLQAHFERRDVEHAIDEEITRLKASRESDATVSASGEG